MPVSCVLALCLLCASFVRGTRYNNPHIHGLMCMAYIYSCAHIAYMLPTYCLAYILLVHCLYLLMCIAYIYTQSKDKQHQCKGNARGKPTAL